VPSTIVQRVRSTPRTRQENLQSLERLIEDAAHVLPSQGPISVFVHHNTLHAFEDMKFAEALARAAEVYGGQSYLSEGRYRQELDRGRIRHDDLVAVLHDDLGDGAEELISLLGTRFHLRLAMLEHSLHMAPSEELQWVIAETDAARVFRKDVPHETGTRMVETTCRWIMRELRAGAENSASIEPELAELLGDLFASFDRSTGEDWDGVTWEALTLQLLWRICARGARSRSLQQAQPPLPRHRDAIRYGLGEDSDELVNDVLTRFTAAYLDQGFAHWSLPERDRGFYAAFIELYGAPGRIEPNWMQGLRSELQRLKAATVGPLESIEDSLARLGVHDEEREEFITATLLALRGWAGMIWQMETNAEWAVHSAPKGALVEFLAVRLILDYFAAAHLTRRDAAFQGDLNALRDAARRRRSLSTADDNGQTAFTFFQVAQVLGLRPEDLYRLPAKSWEKLAGEIEAFSQFERSRVLHLAYERRYTHHALDAVACHAGQAALRRSESRVRPDFQIICCIDDREESFRRHLEEVHPNCETLGYAGFFGVAMYYRGVADAHSRPLCPVVIKPKHYVEELPVFTLEESHRRRERTRRLLGALSHAFHRGSRSLVGGALTALVGSLATAPLVGRILFPRAAAQIRRMFGRFVRPPEATQLLIERSEPDPGPQDGRVGYTLDEMADIVERTLRDNGLTTGLAPLVIMCGHGSSSLNNPHESAYNCGACSGGRGGPNARAFAQMANDPRVRSRLASRGLEVPQDVYFIGAYHNTCSDAVTYFDLDRLLPSHKHDFAVARQAIDEARQRNAHERCRRFESASLASTPKAALAHVEERSEDLSQARPEYNHATNSLTFVGRRSNTRGLYMDRRCFLASYDPAQDDEQGTILERILGAVIPVCAGISLEYYFSCVDPQAYGCGSKLPHNIVSLLGVMEGALSDLRTGLSTQMTEIHEPMRHLFVIETTPAVMARIFDSHPVIGRLCRNDWVLLATIDPRTKSIHVYRDRRFELYRPESNELPRAASSVDWYRGWRDNLGFAQICDAVELAPAEMNK
jgi:uncharacterized protein